MRKLISKKRYVLALIIILISVSIVVTFTLKNKVDYSDLDEFDFSLAFGAHGDSIINTYKSTLTNANYSQDNFVEFKIPKRMKRQIYKVMMQLDILECGNYLSYGVYDYQHPLSYTFQVSIGEETKTIYWSIPWELSAEDIAKLSDEQRRFLSFANFIISYVRGTKEYKKLPKPTRFYLEYHMEDTKTIYFYS